MMVDWNALLQVLTASGAVATAVAVVFKKYTEKQIEHVFDRKLKEYEAKLQAATAVRIGIGTERINEYKKLSGLIQSVRKDAVDLCSNPNAGADEFSRVLLSIRELQNTIYQLSITLNLDGIYERVHTFKIEAATLVKNVENEKNLRDKGQTERAAGVREIIVRSVSGIQSECKAIVGLLVDLIPPKMDS